MYEANIHALLLILAINKFLLGFLVLYLKKRLPNLKGLNYWAYGSIATAIGLFVYSITPYPAQPLVSFAFSFVLLLFLYTGDVLFLNGFFVFFDKPVRKYTFLVPLINVTIATVFTLIVYSTWIRFTFTNLVGFFLYFYAAIVIRKLSGNPRIRELLGWASKLYFFYAFILLVRFAIGLIVKPDDPTHENFISVILISTAGITLILLTFSIIVIIVTKVNEKLEVEISNKNRLHAIIAHDLRNSISNIVNNVTLLKQNIGLSESQTMDLSVKSISSASISSRFLMENLFNWSRSQLEEIVARTTSCNITQILKDSVDIVKPMAEDKGISLVFNLSDKINVLCDESMMGVVFNNLLSNAIKFTQANGQIKVNIIAANDEVEVFVSDTGTGISEKLIKEILSGEVKQSTPGTKKEKGYGFGLMICRRFIAQNNGKFEIVSEPGRGSTFSVTLPAFNNLL